MLLRNLGRFWIFKCAFHQFAQTYTQCQYGSISNHVSQNSVVETSFTL